MSFKKFALAGGVAASLMAGTAYASVIDRPFFQVLGVVVVWGADNYAETGGTAPVVSDFVLLTNTSGSAGADLIGGTAADTYAVVTGSLTPISNAGTAVDSTATIDPVTGETTGGVFADNGTAGVLDAADTLSAFGIDNTTTVGGAVGPAAHTSSFYVASNAAFDIHAAATAPTGSGELFATVGNLSDINYSMGITQSGFVSGTAGDQFGLNAQDPGAGGGVLATGVTLDSLATQPLVFQGTQRTAATAGSLMAQSVRFDNTYTLGTGSYDLSMGAGFVTTDVTYTVYVP